MQWSLAEATEKNMANAFVQNIMHITLHVKEGCAIDQTDTQRLYEHHRKKSHEEEVNEFWETNVNIVPPIRGSEE